MSFAKRLLRSDRTVRAIAWLAYAYMRFVYATSRWTETGAEIPAALHAAGRPMIVAFWHGRLLMLPMMWHRQGPLHMLISGHRDGRIIAGAIAHSGIDTVTGSTTEGGSAALRGMVRLTRNGASVGITPDGPNGPAMRATSGIVAVARLTRAPIVPMVYATSRRRVLDTWDRFHLPLPFTRGVFLWGEAIAVPEALDAAGTEHWRAVVETRMVALAVEADRRVGQPAPAQGTLGRQEWHARRRAAQAERRSRRRPGKAAR